MANDYFSFKQFTVKQGQSAMKVCTDACIFGAWVASTIRDAQQVLDIGGGTGLLSLMYAQQNALSIIDAVEMDSAAAQQSRENFCNSPWGNQLFIHHKPVQEFEPGKKYDLIITNPPFFENDLLSTEDERNLAMHSTSLTLEELIEISMRHLDPSGKFAILLPYHRTEYFLDLAKRSGLYLTSAFSLKQTPNHSFFRSILCFSITNNSQINRQEITIKIAGNTYSDEFISLLQDYYLYL